MELKVRRVVTGHDENGKAIVKMDEISDNVISRRPGHASTVIWSTGSFPADNANPEDGAARDVGTADLDGTVFRIARLAPGVSGRLHRTQSMDYAVVLSGQIELQLEDTSVILRTGDTLVQRGTIHNWVNNETEPCIIAFVLVGAKPLLVGEKHIQAAG